MVLGKPPIQREEGNWVGSFTHSMWIKGLILTPEILAPLEEHRGKALQNTGLGKNFPRANISSRMNQQKELHESKVSNS